MVITQAKHMIPFFDLKAMNERQRDSILEAMTRVFDRGWYILGEEVTIFEEQFANYCGAKHVIGVGNGLDALTLITRGYKELGIFNEGDEIVVASNAYIATILSITENGLVPVFVEPDPHTYNLDIDKIEEAITPRTKGVMALHLYGLVNYSEKLRENAERHNLIVIEDGAQAAGAEWNGIKVGTLGDACGMSLYPTKNLGAIGDAGVVITNNSALADVVRTLANYGSRVKYVNEYQGTNSRLDEIQAAVLGVKLQLLDIDNNAKRELAERYVREIQNPLITLPDMSFGREHSWHLFVVQVENRESFVNHLTENGIGTLIHYPIPPHKQKAYAQWNSRSYPIAERLAERVVSLPLYPVLKEEDIKQIINACNTYSG